ncbi:citrate transporter [Anaerococcus sp. WCA-380-WT-2B]|uniref:Citrate transporter n=1 Tax=Anaerococcus porci TaxID=2652269 RepID=A0A6N7VQD0_9FIRM|nr:citrate transporter [Anaerococcus porci]MSS77092.1 citrate transporter [Anaerococcus porci]
MELAIGIALIISYIGLAIYAARGGNLMTGFFVMAVIWLFFCILGGKLTWEDGMKDILQGGPESWGATAVNVIFGSWFGKILVDTGIASKLIKSVTELGGDDPFIVTLLLSIVTGIIFTATFGAGAVVAIGVIVLPILLSLGVPKYLAVTSYLMSVASGMYLNPVLFSQMQAIFEDMTYNSEYLNWAFIAMAVQLIIIGIMLFVHMKVLNKTKRRKSWDLNLNEENVSLDNVPAIALITPIIPTTLSIAFSWASIPAFIVGSVFGLGVCGKLKGGWNNISRVVSQTFYDGVIDVASLLGFLFILPMFNKISGVAAPFFDPILGDLLPKTTLGLTIAFVIIAPLGLFRGPLTIFGAGAATVGVLSQLGSYSTPFLFTLMYVPTIAMNLAACPTQSWNLWALNYSKVSVKSFMKTGVVWAWLISAINLFLVFVFFGS